MAVLMGTLMEATDTRTVDIHMATRMGTFRPLLLIMVTHMDILMEIMDIRTGTRMEIHMETTR